MTENVTNIESQEWFIADNHKKISTPELFKILEDEMLSLDYESEVGVGTDSQIIGRTFRFITVVCVRRMGKGGYYFYRPEVQARDKYSLKNQKMRMFDEVAKSIELSLKLQEMTGITPTVHVDASPVENEEFTSDFSDQLKGYVQSCGFECMLKPDSYVASTIADKHSKKKSAKKERRREQKLRRKKS